MRQSRTAKLLGATVAVALPLVLIGNAVLVLFQPWIVDAEYALPGFPADPLGLTGADREQLAKAGVRSVAPLGPGVALLERSTLPDGQPAFTGGEINHMQDVRDLVSLISALWLVAVVVLAGCCAWLLRQGRGGEIRTGLWHGCLGLVALAVLLALLMLVAFDFFFDGFHQLFFAAGTWSFAEDETLRRLYPDAFWSIASGALVTLIALQAVLVAWLARRGGAPGTSQERS